VFAGFDAGVAALDELLVSEEIGSDEQVIVLGDLHEFVHWVLLQPQYTNERQKNCNYFIFGASSVVPQPRTFFVLSSR
jgi:hypothetical protein